MKTGPFNKCFFILKNFLTKIKKIVLHESGKNDIKLPENNSTNVI
ncbi:hypothetical protein RV15_GL001201 [Enterococcus silesiacus]|uniref:Uncharacterized protein n=1 Tax=Enterococcus silesiacus TaxID=332949 RepID=A0AA91GCZ1_9ENTE|nr:hypothetical protein RV15_GL001201 [Enterococcus silesiacus]